MMEYKLITPIEKGSTSGFRLNGESEMYFIRHILMALRECSELLEINDYRRLYDEVIDYLFREAVRTADWDMENRAWGYSYVESLADLSNKESGIYRTRKFSCKRVDKYLAHRKAIWDSGCPQVRIEIS